MISDIRSELASKLDIAAVQSILALAWGRYLTDTNVLLTDATVDERYMRYPTEEKLLWECCEWLYKQMKKTCKLAGLRMPGNKYADQKSKYLSYQKNKKKTYQLKQKRIKSLLYPLNNSIGWKAIYLIGYNYLPAIIKEGPLLSKFTDSKAINIKPVSIQPVRWLVSIRITFGLLSVAKK